MTRPALQLIFDRTGRAAGVELDDAALVELYRYPDDGRRRLRSNFVSSLDGSVQGADGRSGGLGTASDQHVFALHRALADAVVVGASTARAEGYRAVDLQPWQRDLRASLGLAPFPALVVVTGSARLDPVMATPAEGDGGPVVVLTTTGKPDADLDPLREAGIEVREEGEELDLGAALDRLAGEGRPRLLCEGGPGLHRALLAAGLVDELSLTLAPVVVGGEGMRSTSGPGLGTALPFDLSFALHGADGALFTSYRSPTTVDDGQRPV
ncbi:dihydrofolate reductase family protein [Microlunatus capsulatus]|uniref:Riboflavin biosynthesis pyrimidine reductase n=1 Tax=Microlunatus capsulatus TaxID=99117 RepID=A0ABS4ZE20_9ACTN|nr:dihydrofolate reductase family protein [Microlunatus capsulatus]MBP2419015.1 riboflavin biosynthesis pyrimidine reductase [Microlunatus capsulatus]